MKKIFALFLVLALLLPIGMAVQAEEVEIRPFYLNQWDHLPVEMTNVYQMAYFWTDRENMDNLLECVCWAGVTSYHIPEVAEALKEEFNARPEGTRYINFCLAQDTFHAYAENVVFVEKAVEKVQVWLKAFLEEYSKIGGKLDGLVLDVEFENMYATYIESRFSVDNPLVYKEITENPIYAEKIRPALVERGFKFYDNITDYTPEIYSIDSDAGEAYKDCASIWNAVLNSYINSNVTEACEPLWQYYPDAEVSDYTSKNVYPWLKEQGDMGGTEGDGGIITTAGTSSNENYYSTRPSRYFTDWYGTTPLYHTIPGYNRAVYGDKVFNYFLYEANIMKNTYLASDDGEVSFWIAHYLYNLEDENAASLTPYYTEQLFHMGMLNPQSFMGYIIHGEIGTVEDYAFCLQLVDDVLQELTRVAGAADRKPINVTPSWNEHYVLSGMTAGGRNIWRITPDTSMVSVADFKVEGAADPTFSVNGQTVTFPQGKIIETSSIRGWDADRNVITDNSCGYWVETPADVIPVVTRADNYHSVYPAYGEDYENYEVGTEYNYKNALPATCWEVKKVGSGSATIVADPANADNKVLALKGGYLLKNVNLPKNITAGDTYAEHQAWEVEITLPSDMATDAELILLNFSGDKKKSDDGGFKIAGNKIYYSDNGEYAELATLTPGSKYRLVREMDFTNPDALSCNYYVYDATNKLIASATKVAVSPVELPVAGIGISCTGIAGDAVLLDNYKLYPTDVGLDFELYDATTGMKITDLDAPRTSSTAYRLSWLNAKQTQQVYSVIAAYYNGDKLIEEKVIQEVKMAPNMEGVVTGEIEIKEDQSVRIYLRKDSKDDSNAPSSGLSTLLLITIIASAVIIVVAVAALLLIRKKKASAKEKTE